VQALRFELGKVETPAIRERMVGLLAQVDKTLAGLVAQGLGIAVPAKLDGPLNMSIPADGNVKHFQPKRLAPSLERSQALSMATTVKDGIATRKIAILAADGVDDAALSAMKKALMAAGARAKVVAPRLGVLKGVKGADVNVDFSFLTAASVLFDAVYVPGGEKSVEILKGDAKAVLFVKEAYLHCKTIAATDAGIDAVLAAHLASEETAKTHAEGVRRDEQQLLAPDEGVILSRKGHITQVAEKFINAIAQHRHWDRETKGQVPA
jgi:catalase